MKLLDIIFSVIVIASVVLCHQIITHSIANQDNKIDYAELSHIQYGLLNIEAWKEQIAPILAGEIDRLYLSRTNEQLLRQHIEVLLNRLIDQIDKKIRKENSETVV